MSSAAETRHLIEDIIGPVSIGTKLKAVLPFFADMVAMYLCKELTPKSLPEMGQAFGGRDHTTVLSAIRKITKLVECSPALAGQVREITTNLRVGACAP